MRHWGSIGTAHWERLYYLLTTRLTGLGSFGLARSDELMSHPIPGPGLGIRGPVYLYHSVRALV